MIINEGHLRPQLLPLSWLASISFDYPNLYLFFRTTPSFLDYPQPSTSTEDFYLSPQAFGADQ